MPEIQPVTPSDPFSSQIAALEKAAGNNPAYKQQLEQWEQQIKAVLDGTNQASGVQQTPLSEPGNTPVDKSVVNNPPNTQQLSAWEQPAKHWELAQDQPDSAPQELPESQPSTPGDQINGSETTTTSPVTSDGTGPNSIEITNSQDHAITLGKFKNGESTTDPSATITLQPGQTGTIQYENGEAGIITQADSSGTFKPDASRLEYEADADGKMKYPDVSYIDGRNASISLTDGAELNKGDSKSIAGQAPENIVTTDADGNKTITGWYDGSTQQMQDGGDYMENQLGTSGAYLHPDDDRLATDQNPMSGTESTTLKATFGDA